MPFSQATMLGDPRVRPDGRDLLVTWASSAPAGTWFQVYRNGRLYWWGTERRLWLPRPRDWLRLDVGTVLPSEVGVDFSGQGGGFGAGHFGAGGFGAGDSGFGVPAAPPDRARLDWQGGFWQSATIAGYRIYGPAVAGGPVDFSKALATVPATVQGVRWDGFGVGGFGSGGFGADSGAYSWTSKRLASGTWTFAVAPFDRAGNEAGSPLSASATIAAPPLPPARDARGARLTYAFTPGTPGGFGAGPFGAGGFGRGAGNFGFGSGGFGGAGFGVGDGAGNPSVTLNWQASG